ncbi:hypothetical protein HDK64DRAFT_251034 [Phyllosticta capitalensis]
MSAPANTARVSMTDAEIASACSEVATLEEKLVEAHGNIKRRLNELEAELSFLLRRAAEVEKQTVKSVELLRSEEALINMMTKKEDEEEESKFDAFKESAEELMENVDEAPQSHGRRAHGHCRNLDVLRRAIDGLSEAFIVQLSGTLPHDCFDNVSTYINLLQGHPFTTHISFLREFASPNGYGRPDAPDPSRMQLLQTFLTAFSVARRATVIKPPPMKGFHADFGVDSQTVFIASELVEKFHCCGGSEDTIDKENTGRGRRWQGYQQVQNFG